MDRQIAWSAEMRRNVALAGILLAACRGEPQPGLAPSVRDSAGVQIVEYPAGYEATLPRRLVIAMPLVDIGGQDAPGHDLDLVGDATRLSDGHLVVADRGSGELRLFDSTGTFLHAIGRRGKGPGEFGAIGALQRLKGDSLLVFDPMLRRVTRFSSTGQFAETANVMHVSEGSLLLVNAQLTNGRYLGDERTIRDYSETSGPVRRDSFALVLVDGSGGVQDTLVVVPGDEAYPGLGREGGQEFPTIKPVQFGRGSVWATDGTRIHVGTNEPGGIRVYDSDGTLRRIIRSATPPETVTEAHRQQRIKENLARINRQGLSEQVKGEWRKNEEDARFAEAFPYYERLLVDAEGSLWVEQARRTEDEGRRYVVFDSAGRALASVRSIDRFRPLDISPDLIVGMWRDADEVNHVRVHAIRRDP
jgi:hypothetical protein